MRRTSRPPRRDRGGGPGGSGGSGSSLTGAGRNLLGTTPLFVVGGGGGVPSGAADGTARSNAVDRMMPKSVSVVAETTHKVGAVRTPANNIIRQSVIPARPTCRDTHNGPVQGPAGQASLPHPQNNK
jgi:hypothetical protein